MTRGRSDLPDSLRRVLPADTATTWALVAPVVPQTTYLGGGTGLAAHLEHRASRDLDFFFHAHSVDLDELAAELRSRGPFVVTERSPGTLNGLFSQTNVQFLHADEARPQKLLEEPTVVAGLRVAGLSDLMAMKLKVVGERGELRDYFDLMVLERQAGRRVEEGLTYFVERYDPEIPAAAVASIVQGLGYFGDVDEDELLPVPKVEIERYWKRRQPAVLRSAGWFSDPGGAR